MTALRNLVSNPFQTTRGPAASKAAADAGCPPQSGPAGAPSTLDAARVKTSAILMEGHS